MPVNRSTACSTCVTTWFLFFLHLVSLKHILYVLLPVKDLASYFVVMENALTPPVLQGAGTDVKHLKDVLPVK
jgi:hypothetical protein